MHPRRLTPLLLSALAISVISGCSGETPTPTPTSTPTSQATAGPATATPTAPPAARLGATKTISLPDGPLKATAYAYQQPLPSRVPPERKGYEYAGLDAKVCVPIRGTVSWSPWSITFADDTVIEPVSSWNAEDYSVPLYPPTEREVQAGRCVRGWVVFEVPKGKKPTLATYVPEAGGAAEWAVP